MTTEELLQVLRGGESSMVEFKRCSDVPHMDVYETVCSFANRMGGSIYLGVDDDGEIHGVNMDRAIEIERNIVNVTSNRKLFAPAPNVETERIDCDGKLVIRIWVSPSSSVIRLKGVVYDRLADVDVRLDGDIQISQMYIRKQNYYSERRIFRYVTPFDLRTDLIARVRQMAENQRAGHPWKRMSDEELFRSAKLYDRDYTTGEEGFNLAAVLLLGKDEVINSVCPAYVTDAIVRKENLDRYDDRLMVRTNLIDSYERLVEFVGKNLPDRFALDGDKRTSPRDIIVRELVANSLMHREYSSPIMARIIVDNEAIRTVNASRSFFEGRMRLGEFTPMPKNPIIADFFVQIGIAEKLGSGLRNLMKASELYTGNEPEFSDGDVFKAMIPISRMPAAVMGDHNNLPADEATDSSEDVSTAAIRTETASSKPGERYRLAGSGASAIPGAVRLLLFQQDSITVPEVAKVSGADGRTVRAYLNKLVADGSLTAVGKTRGKRYLKIQEPSAL